MGYFNLIIFNQAYFKVVFLISTLKTFTLFSYHSIWYHQSVKRVFFKKMHPLGQDHEGASKNTIVAHGC